MNLRIPNSSLRSFLAAAMIAAAFSSPRVACAGVVIEGEQKLQEGEPISTSVAISDGKARTESAVNGQMVTMIYRSDKDLIWLVDDTAKTYREMTRSDMGKMMEQVDKALKEVREQFKALPPEQQKMMEDMMGDQLASLAKTDPETVPEISYKKIGDGGELNGWPTVKYEGTLNGAKASEVWAAPASAVKVGPAEMKTMENMMGFFREFAGKFGVDSLTALGPEGGLQGVPIKVIIYSNGAPASAYAVKSIVKKSLPASQFEVPEGYTKEEMIAPGWK